MIAISYRREDSLPVAGRLYDRLQAEFGKDQVFMDFDSIPYGVDFRDHIRQIIGRSKLVVAIIGANWAGRRRFRGRRIDDPADFVRLEVSYALEKGLPVIPVLLNDTPMPRAAELPKDIERLAFRNALILDAGVDFHHHAERLIAGIDRLLNSPVTEAPVQVQTPLPQIETPPPISLPKPAEIESPKSPIETPPVRHWRRPVFLGAAALLVLMAAAAILYPSMRARTRGALRISTIPKGMAFEVFDQKLKTHAGTTPASIYDLPAGITLVSLRLGKNEHQEIVEIKGGETFFSTWSVPEASLPETEVIKPPPPPPETPPWKDAIEKFVREFVASNDSADVDRAVSFYAPNAEIFDEGMKSLDAIRQDIQTYQARWPIRKSGISGEVHLNEKLREQEYGASFQQDYYVMNTGSREWIKGAVAVDLRINILNGSLKISSIKQKALSREKGAGSAPSTLPKAITQLGPQGLLRIQNKTYGFSVLVPADIFPEAAHSSDTDQTLFSSPDGKTTLKLLVQDLSNQTMEAVYQGWSAEHTRTQPNKKVHYKVLRAKWFVASGIDGNRGFYVKGVKKGNLLIMMSLDYDENASPLKTETLLKMVQNFNGD